MLALLFYSTTYWFLFSYFYFFAHIVLFLSSVVFISFWFSSKFSISSLNTFQSILSFSKSFHQISHYILYLPISSCKYDFCGLFFIMLLRIFTFKNFSSSWVTKHFILIRWFNVLLVMVLALKTNLSHISIAPPSLFGYSWHDNFVHLSLLNLLNTFGFEQHRGFFLTYIRLDHMSALVGSYSKKFLIYFCLNPPSYDNFSIFPTLVHFSSSYFNWFFLKK